MQEAWIRYAEPRDLRAWLAAVVRHEEVRTAAMVVLERLTEFDHRYERAAGVLPGL